MEIFHILLAIKRKWYFLVIVPLLSTIIMYFIVRELKNEYKSTAQLATGITIQNSLTSTVQRQSILDINLQFNNLTQNISSTTVLSFVSYRLAIHDIQNPNERFRSERLSSFIEDSPNSGFLETAFNFYKQNLIDNRIIETGDPKHVPYKDFLKYMGYDIDDLRKGLNIFRVGVSDYLNISFTSENPNLSAFVVNTLCDEFLRYQIETIESSTNESIRFFESLVEEKKIKLDQKSMDLSAYKEINNLLDLEAESRSKITREEQLQEARLEENRKIRSLNTELDIITERINGLRSRSSATNNQDQNTNTELIRVRNKVNELNTKYINTGQQDNSLLDSLNYYRSVYRNLTEMQSNRLTTNETGTNLNNLIERRNDLEMQIKIASANLLEIDNRIVAVKSNASDYATKESKLQELTRERDLAADEYLRFQTRLNEVRNNSLLGGNSVNVVLRGQPPVIPEKSKKVILIAISFIGSFAIVLMIIVVTELLDFSVKTPTRFKDLSDLNLIGILTLINKKRINSNDVFKQNDNEYLNYLECLRKIRYEFEQHFQNKIILITSSQPGQGKSFFIKSLAHSLSSINRKVLIIDMNFKNNFLTRQYLHGIDAKNINMLSRKINPAKTNWLKDFIIANNKRGNYFIGCELSKDSPFEIFGNVDIKSELKFLVGEFDYILIEGPSLNDFSDSKELENLSDAVVSLVSANSTVNQMDRESFKYFKLLNNKYKGCILNSVAPYYLTQL